MRRGLLALLALALAAPLAASAGGGGGAEPSAATYLDPALARAAVQTPAAPMDVIVQSADGSSRARKLLDRFGTSGDRLEIVDAASGAVPAGALPELAEEPGLVITRDNPVVLSARLPRVKPPRNGQLSSSELWPQAVGVDQLWSNLTKPRPRIRPLETPTIAFVDSGIEAGRDDFGDRVLAQVDLTSLPGNSPGDGYGHGTAVAGMAAGSAAGYTGSAPTAGIVSLDVMDDEGKAMTSDVIRAAEWILHNHERYSIRVANFSLHSSTQSSFRWDPLDKAVEKLWFAGVVVVASAGNEGQGERPVRMGYAPGNDPFVITVGALDLHNSTSADRADVPPWSSWGYTLDGFAKPELSAPGRTVVAPVPAASTLANAAQLKAQVTRRPAGSYARLSGTSLSTPIVAGIAADLLALNPDLTPDRVKGALMLSALSVRKARGLSAGVGEASAPAAALITRPPNPNRALDAFLVRDPAGAGLVFDDVSWLDAVRSSRAWDSASWLDGWAGAAWSLVSWSDVSWSDVSWSDVSWSDVSWSDVSWSDALRVYADVD